VTEEEEPSFKPFTGAANRIDGKALPNKMSPSSKEDIAQKRLAALSKDTAVSEVKSPTESKEPPRQSKIGDKYSKKKIANAAFTGQANRLG